MIDRNYTDAVKQLGSELVKLDPQLGRAIVRAGKAAMRKPNPGAVKLYLLALAIEEALAQTSKPAPRRKPRAKRAAAE